MNFVSFNFDEKDSLLLQKEACLISGKGISYVLDKVVFNSKIEKIINFGTDIFILGVKRSEDDWERRFCSQ